jgi:hypothetical protein
MTATSLTTSRQNDANIDREHIVDARSIGSGYDDAESRYAV